MDPVKTRHYYESLTEEDLCDCHYCRNFRRHVKEAYPAVAEYLKSLGADIEKTFESFPLDPGPQDEIEYLDVQYVILGSPEGFQLPELPDMTVEITDVHPPTDLEEEHFVIQLYPFRLKWTEE